MAGTKKQPPARPKPPSVPPALNGPLGEVLTLAEAAAYLRLSESDVLRLVEEQGLPGRQLEKEWRFLKDALRDWLRTGPPHGGNKEAWMALAGVWKDDPYVEEELRGIYERRGRSLTEGEG